MPWGYHEGIPQSELVLLKCPVCKEKYGYTCDGSCQCHVQLTKCDECAETVHDECANTCWKCDIIGCKSCKTKFYKCVLDEETYCGNCIKDLFVPANL
jgi:hypothetical protein